MKISVFCVLDICCPNVNIVPFEEEINKTTNNEKKIKFVKKLKFFSETKGSDERLDLKTKKLLNSTKKLNYLENFKICVHTHIRERVRERKGGV